MLRNLLLVFFLHISLISLVTFRLINYQAIKPDNNKSLDNVKGITSHVSVSALIGFRGFQETRSLTIFGYTSPKALVVLENELSPQSTTAQIDGYYEIKDAIIPLHQREACISAYDSFGRLTTPICIPLSDYSIDKDDRIGPVVLSPTISSDKGNYFIGDDSVISGQTIPNSKVYISIYQDTKTKLSLIPNTYAFSIPEIETLSDKDGNYSVSFPTNHASNYRVFIRSSLNEDFSPKSNTLYIQVYPFYMYFIAFIKFVLRSISKHLLELFLLGEAFIFLYFFIRRFFNPFYISKSRAIVLYQPQLPIKGGYLPTKGGYLPIKGGYLPAERQELIPMVREDN